MPQELHDLYTAVGKVRRWTRTLPWAGGPGVGLLVSAWARAHHAAILQGSDTCKPPRPSRGLTLVLPLVILRQRHLRIRRRRLEAIWSQPALGGKEIHDGVGRLARRV